MNFMKLRKNSGFILMLVLSILAVLVILVINLVQIVALERQLSADHINKSRSRLLAYSGVEYVKAQFLNVSSSLVEIKDDKYFLGRGTFALDADGFTVSAKDSSGMININDGIIAGQLESTYDSDKRSSMYKWDYIASAVNPWPIAGSSENVINKNLENPDKSGLVNLRLRRLLNAFGDSHLYECKVGEAPYNGSESLDSFSFTSTAYKDKGESIPLETVSKRGLGDEIINNRPQLGYDVVDEVKNIVNNWATRHKIPSTYYTDEGWDTFFDKVKDDLAVEAFEDDKFYRLRTETASTLDYAAVDNPFNTAESPYMWKMQNDYADCRFYPNYLDRFPIDLTDDSGNGTLDENGAKILAVNNLWAPHSVSLINLNMASPHVRAAVFYAPTNVSYLCEGAVTHHASGSEKQYGTRRANSGRWDATSERGMARSSIGVRGVCFNPDRMTENGFSIDDDPEKVQKNRLMSLRDAKTLASHYENYVKDLTKPIYNFDDFKTFLIDYRRRHSPNDPNPIDGPAFERAEIIPLDASGNIELPSSGSSYYDKHIKLLYGNETVNPYKPGDPQFDPHRDDVVWVSHYWPKESGSGGEFEGGWFLDDYVERTLPHIFSCIRRIPGYLGAPMALTSPYMIVEPFNYKDPINQQRATGSASDNHSTPTKPGFVENFMDLPDAEPLPKMLGTQPKISVEDLVTRHTIPKVCFTPMGVLDISSIGFVDNPHKERVAQTTIRASLQLFESRYFRTQEDFVKLLKKGIGTGSDQTNPNIVFGPEFKVDTGVVASPSVMPSERVQSKYWLAMGLADMKSSQMGKVDPSHNVEGNENVKGWDLYMEADPYDKNGGLGQTTNSDITTFLPDYGSSEWKDLYDDSFTLSPIALGGSSLPGMSSKTNLSKIDARKRAPYGTTLLKTGDMERADKTLWAQQDGHDLDPWGQGIFFGQSGSGFGALRDISEFDPTVDPPKHPDTFRDSMYWNLNNKLKTWSLLTSDPRAKDSNGNYLFAVDINNGTPGQVGPFEDGDDINPVGLSFHRSFFSTWFRIPTSYPFPHSVSWSRYDWDPSYKAGLIFPPHGVVAHKRQLFKNIMSLEFHSLDNWYLNRSPRNTDVTYSRGIIDVKVGADKEHPKNYSSGGHCYLINVGYYSGYDDKTNNFDFEHGIRGSLNATRFEGGLPTYRPSSTKWADKNHQHPLYYHAKRINRAKNAQLFGDVGTEVEGFTAMTAKPTRPPNMGFPTQSAELNPYYGKSHGYFWDYDHLVPVQFRFDEFGYDESFILEKPSTWAGGSIDLGYQVQTNGNDYQNYNENTIVGTFICWKQDYGTLRKILNNGNRNRGYLNNGYEDESGPEIMGFPPQNNMLYASYELTQEAGLSTGCRIIHDLRMNDSPECAPGSWHRIYAFWFLRFNPGQMGINDPTHSEMGDTFKYSRSEWWDERYYDTYHNGTGTILDRDGPYQYPPKPTATDPGGLYLPHGGTGPKGINPGLTAEFGATSDNPECVSRYAKDDQDIGSHVNTNAAFDVDGLDQFGIWFRDDSNYTEWCSNQMNPFANLDVKPKFYTFWISNLTRHAVRPDSIGPKRVYLARTENDAVLLSIGDVQQRRYGSYIPESGEIVDVPNVRNRTLIDYAWMHYPAFRFDSTIDNIIFGYGSDISVPGQSYFRGLFHNAQWLADNTDNYDDERHPDELRYDVEEEPLINFELVSPDPGSNAIPLYSNIFHVGCRIYNPRDDYYNYSALEFNAYHEDTLVTEASLAKSSNNGQNHFFYTPVNTNDFRCQFQYKNHTPEQAGGLDIEYQSRIINFNQEDGLEKKYEFAGGDSFTNIPYPQEMMVQFHSSSGLKYLRWLEN